SRAACPSAGVAAAPERGPRAPSSPRGVSRKPRSRTKVSGPPKANAIFLRALSREFGREGPPRARGGGGGRPPAGNASDHRRGGGWGRRGPRRAGGVAAASRPAGACWDCPPRGWHPDVMTDRPPVVSGVLGFPSSAPPEGAAALTARCLGAMPPRRGDAAIG